MLTQTVWFSEEKPILETCEISEMYLQFGLTQRCLGQDCVKNECWFCPGQRWALSKATV